MTIRVSILGCALAVLAVAAGGSGPVAAPQTSPPPAAPAAAPPAAPADMSQLVEQALGHLRARLKLTEEQTARIRPLLAEHMTGVRQMFLEYSDPAGGQLPALMQEFRERRERFRTNLQPILTPPQMQELDVIRKEVDESLRDTICNERLSVLKARLTLTPDQETALRPILMEDFEKKRDLVAVMAAPTGGPAARKAPTAQFAAIQSQTEDQMRKILDAKQMAAYESYRDELRAKATDGQ
jgi:hypothetical protein